ncbi:MAG: hypothetical protein ACRDRA_08910 [Pseudonocardiaceae bacterium]
MSGSFTVKELGRLVTTSPATLPVRAHDPPEREALGVVALGIELVDPPR